MGPGSSAQVIQRGRRLRSKVVTCLETARFRKVGLTVKKAGKCRPTADGWVGEVKFHVPGPVCDAVSSSHRTEYLFSLLPVDYQMIGK